MTLPTKTIQQFVDAMTATWNAETGLVATFESGDVLLAWWQSVAAQFDFLQAKIATVLKLTRAGTSNGADLDTWMAQFDFVRLAASFSTGTVTFSTALPAASPIVVSLGSIVQTQGGAIQYQVVADTNNAAYSAPGNGYVLSAGASSVNVTVQALQGGASSNVAAGQIVQMGSSIPGIYSVTNGASFTNGLDAESDAAFRSRFILYLATLAKATRKAILAAALGVQQSLSVTPLENQRADGTTQMGAFTLVVDDGSGSPPRATLDAIYSAVDETRAFSVQPYVVAPQLLTAIIGITIRIDPNAVSAVVIANVEQTIANIVNQLGPGAICYTSAINAAAMLVSGVIAVRSGTTINGTAADLTPTPSQEVRTTISNITVGTY